MITNEVVNTLYKKFSKLPKSPDDLDIPLLIDNVGGLHQILINPDDNTMTIGSIDPMSPFHTLSLKRINAFVPFEEWVAIVLHSSIIFLNKKAQKVYVHIKPHKNSLLDKIKDKLNI